MTQQAPRVALLTTCGKPTQVDVSIARKLSKSGIAVVTTTFPLTENGDAADHETTCDSLELNPDDVAFSFQRALADLSAGTISSRQQPRSLIAEIVRQYGRLDILINNTGEPPIDEKKDLDHPRSHSWEQLLDEWQHITGGSNVKRVLLMSCAALTPMKRNGWGRIINISSAMSRFAPRYPISSVAFETAVVNFTEEIAREIAGSGVTANTICSGPIRITRQLNLNDIEAAALAAGERLPAWSANEADDVANLACFLASDASRHISGRAVHFG
jgi:NAD(P)-dependent dehydrogenase (short-subunit alcohol dehydrogenase family)